MAVSCSINGNNISLIKLGHINPFRYGISDIKIIIIITVIIVKDIKDNIGTWDLLKFDGKSNRPDSLQRSINPSPHNDDADFDGAGNE